MTLALTTARAQSTSRPAVVPTSQDQFFDSRGTKLRYVVSGPESAEPVIFINGFPESLEVWSPVVTAGQLSRYRLIRFDPRGLGKSGKPHGPESYGVEMANDVVRLLDHLEIKKAHVVGYSMGGWIALKLVMAHPDRLLTATLGGNAGLHPSQQARHILLADALRGKDVTAAIAKLKLPVGRSIPKEEANGTAQSLRDWASDLTRQQDAQAIAPMMRGFAALIVSHEELKMNSVPVLALYSNENDPGRPLAGEITALATWMPKAELAQIQNANHGNARSKPEFVEALAQFLAKHSLLRRAR